MPSRSQERLLERDDGINSAGEALGDVRPPTPAVVSISVAEGTQEFAAQLTFTGGFVNLTTVSVSISADAAPADVFEYDVLASESAGTVAEEVRALIDANPSYSAIRAGQLVLVYAVDPVVAIEITAASIAPTV